MCALLNTNYIFFICRRFLLLLRLILLSFLPPNCYCNVYYSHITLFMCESRHSTSYIQLWLYMYNNWIRGSKVKALRVVYRIYLRLITRLVKSIAYDFWLMTLVDRYILLHMLKIWCYINVCEYLPVMDKHMISCLYNSIST